MDSRDCCQSLVDILERKTAAWTRGVWRTSREGRSQADVPDGFSQV